MTHDEAKKRVQAIREAAGDFEIAHRLEDELYHSFVRHVAAHTGQHRAIAEEILKTDKIEFVRWCA